MSVVSPLTAMRPSRAKNWLVAVSNRATARSPVAVAANSTQAVAMYRPGVRTATRVGSPMAHIGLMALMLSWRAAVKLRMVWLPLGMLWAEPRYTRQLGARKLDVVTPTTMASAG